MSRGVGISVMAAVLVAGAAVATVSTAGAGEADVTASPPVASVAASAVRSVEPVAVPSTVAPSSPLPTAVTATARPTTVKVEGTVPIEYGEFDEIYAATACQGGGGGYLGFPDDLRMMSLQVGAPVIVTNGKGKKAASGKLGRGELSDDGNDCAMPFTVTVKLAGGGPYRFTIGTRCNDCDYPSVITAEFSAQELADPVEVDLEHWR